MLALELCGIQGCWTGSGSECEKAPFVPGHDLAGEGFDVVRMRRTGAYVINVKTHLADNHTCTLCTNRFQNGQVKNCKSFSSHLFFMASFTLLYPKHLFYSVPPAVFSSLCTMPHFNYFFLHLHPHIHPVICLLLRFRGSQQQCSTGVPSVAAANSFLVPSTTL